MIKIESLVKKYGNLYALNGIGLEIGEGEIVGLLGPNGAGKSTTMNILTGYLSPTSGEVTVGGFDVSADPIAVKRQIGYLPEQPPLYPDMTVGEYLSFVYQLKGTDLPCEEHLSDVMSAVRIAEVKNRLIRNLSKGYKQRVGIAQALIGNPPVLIFDEPTVGLDPKQIIEIRNLLRTLAKSHTVILSTHILSEVQAVCGRVIIIDRGEIVADAKTDELSRGADDGVAYRYRIAGPEKQILSSLKSRPGVSKVRLLEKQGEGAEFVLEGERGVDVRKTVFQLCASNSWPILELSPVGAELEDIFLRLTEGKKSN